MGDTLRACAPSCESLLKQERLARSTFKSTPVHTGLRRTTEMADGKPKTKSGFGPQSFSNRRSAPSYSIGKAPNHVTVPKEFLSPEHEKSVNAGLHSPGPAVYDSKSSLNEQVQSKKRTAPSFAFGTASRFRAPKGASSSPGPGTY